MAWKEGVFPDLAEGAKSREKKPGTVWHGAVCPVPFGAFLQRNKLEKQTCAWSFYFTRILPFASSVPCTRTRLPSNLATSV